VKIIFAIAAFVIVSSLQAEDKEITKDKSPDGKFALSISTEQGESQATIIRTRTKEDVVALEANGDYVERAKLVWSKDSQWVAYFSPNRRGGLTTVYFRTGSEFKEIPLPQLPDCTSPPKKDGDEYVKTLDYTVSPVRWLKGGGLMLAISNQWLLQSGSEPECSETVTISFNAKHEASIQNVTTEK
jgi:hypothetical protein